MGESGVPQFKRPLTNITVPVGSFAKFIVEIRGSSPLTVTWSRNEVPVQNSDRLVLLQDGGVFCIQIQQVIPSDEGLWECHVKNEEGEISCCALLNIQVPQVYRAPRFVAGLRGCLWDNGTLSLECDVLGVPTPNLRWYRDGKALSPGSSLTIRAYSRESKSFLGMFAVEAQNCMGVDSCFSKVYARNFASYLAQVGAAVKRTKDDKTISRRGGEETTLSLENKSDNEDNDSGIAEDTKQ